MTHPEELLAGYVDGTLSLSERGVVDAHLPGCAKCREELSLASAVVPTLASLPEVPVPLGVTGPVLAEARGHATSRAGSRFGKVQRVLGLAAAAALVLVIALNLPNFGGNSTQRAEGQGGAVPATAPSPLTKDAVGLEQRNVNYDTDSVQALAKTAADAAKETFSASDSGATGTALAAASDVAIGCLQRSGAEFSSSSRLVELIDARYRDTPAYLGVFVQSPSAGKPADHAVVWIVAKQDCSFLSAASQQI